MPCSAKILRWTKAYKIPFNSPPYQNKKPKQPRLNREEEKLYTNIISELLKSGAIKKVRNCENQFLSSYFLRKKPDGKYRFILNLKKLNKFLTAPHFKLEDIRSAKHLILRKMIT